MGDEAVWKYNLEIRSRNAAVDEVKRREARLRAHEEERQRIEPFLKMQRAAHDGRIDNKNLASGSNWVPPAVEGAPARARESAAREPGSWAY